MIGNGHRLPHGTGRYGGLRNDDQWRPVAGLGDRFTTPVIGLPRAAS
jgi:hypothetical protein